MKNQSKIALYGSKHSFQARVRKIPSLDLQGVIKGNDLKRKIHAMQFLTAMINSLIIHNYEKKN